MIIIIIVSSEIIQRFKINCLCFRCSPHIALTVITSFIPTTIMFHGVLQWQLHPLFVFLLLLFLVILLTTNTVVLVFHDFDLEFRQFSKHASAGFRVMAFPCNQFGAQEPGDNRSIQKFASDHYGVTFDLYAKVKGICEHCRIHRCVS